MIIQRVIVVLMIAVVLYFLIFQVFVPFFKGTKFFPIFRKSRVDLQARLTEATTRLEEKELLEDVESLESKLNSENIKQSKGDDE